MTQFSSKKAASAIEACKLCETLVAQGYEIISITFDSEWRVYQVFYKLN